MAGGFGPRPSLGVNRMGIMARETVPDIMVAYHYLMTPRIRSEDECTHYFEQFVKMASRLEDSSHISAHAMTWGVYERILDYEELVPLTEPDSC